ncbi:hypothetical protein [Noviherbaspirillum malthae]|uniref:hypothetical protein n=1 Tax=Noviherbaspirillum malthae TaxID=1260987 RepID=UPI00188EA9EB|nr:hypothetical protein [Noviherbaspirillum malthae]
MIDINCSLFDSKVILLHCRTHGKTGSGNVAATEQRLPAGLEYQGKNVFRKE